ncbi:hypothetical protein [Desulfocurvus sp.]|jgi:hypothetical protein|uniref:hypothetical protein n=1 Tax=Desulfocurvus sp. TaxID=2871698 RepID=UPI0025BC1F8F|nr:hypothetical protein [Desulfocurvus sp.]MCK9240863.1 zinc-ribbon domain-containing protein [Desulfocurvus sp.]
MYVQCVSCVRKYRFDPAAVPAGGASAVCKGCGARLPVAPRDNAEADAARPPVTKAAHQKELKWYARSDELLRGMGYQRKTAEYNMLFFMLREFRKRLGITFFDMGCSVRLKRVDRELAYNRLSFFGDCCVAPVPGGPPSCIPDLLCGMAEVLRAKDSARRFCADELLRVAYPDSFPVLVRFVLGVGFETSYAETVYGSAVQIDIGLDAVRELPEGYDGADLERRARVEISRVPIETGALPLAELLAPGLHLRPGRDPDLRCASPVLDALLAHYAGGAD